MSFDLCILDIDKSCLIDQVREIYEKVCDGEYAAAKASDKIEPFFQELCSRYPQIDEIPDEKVKDCPWSCAHEISDGYVITSIRWSRAAEIFPVVVQLALKHELACYDPQGHKVYSPSH